MGSDIGNVFFINFKIGLENIALQTFLQMYNKILKDEFMRNNIFLLEQDITTDLAGCFDYEIVKKHLIDTHDFVFEGDERNTQCIDDIEYNDTKPFNGNEIGNIRNNEKSHGLNVITFLIKVNGLKCRVKLYNKYLSNIICCGVRKTFGNHFIDTINQKGDRYKSLYNNKEFQNKGIMRIEITIYYNDLITDYNFYDDIMHRMYDYFNGPIYYHTSFTNQIKALADNIHSNTLFYDNEYKNFYLVYFTHYLNNKKIIGIIKNCKGYNSKEIYNTKNFILSAYSYAQKPIYYFELLQNNNEYKIYKKAYIKLNDNPTILNQNNIFSCGQSNYKIDISKYGFSNDHSIKFDLLRKKYDKKSLPIYEMKGINNLNIKLNFLSQSEINKIILDDMHAKTIEMTMKDMHNTYNNEINDIIIKNDKRKKGIRI